MDVLNSFGTFEPPPFDQQASSSGVVGGGGPYLFSERAAANSSSTSAFLVNYLTSTGEALGPLFSNSSSSGELTSEQKYISQLYHDNSSYFSSTFFGDALVRINHSYRQVHGELSLGVCIFGILANVLNIIVLSRKNMISPTNTILMAMAVSDLVVIATYLPFVIHNFFRQSIPIAEMFTYGWAVYTLGHAHISVVFHTISIWLTVLLAVWRYITVRSPTGNRSSCSLARARAAIALTFLVVPCLCTPVFLNFGIYPFYDELAGNETLYKVDMIHFNANETQYQVLLEKINFWAFSVLLKFIPCILLTLMSILLIRILCDAQKRKERLLARANENAMGKTVPVSSSATSTHLLRPSNASNNDFRSGGRGGSGQTSLTNLADSVTKKSSQVYLEMTPQSGMGNSYDSKIYSVDGVSRHASFDSKLCQHLADKVSSVCCCCCCGIGFCFCVNCSRGGQGKQERIKVKVSQPTCNNNSSNNNIGGSSVTLFRHSSQRHLHQHHHHHLSVASSERTTKMLIVVLIVFLICEIPAGILAFLSGILGKMFFANVYNNFGELQDMLALINSAVNFVLYCSMSQQFRSTFSQLFCVPWLVGGSERSGVQQTRCTVVSNFSPKASSKPSPGTVAAAGVAGVGPAITTPSDATIAGTRSLSVQNSTLQANYLAASNNVLPTAAATTTAFVGNKDSLPSGSKCVHSSVTVPPPPAPLKVPLRATSISSTEGKTVAQLVDCPAKSSAAAQCSSTRGNRAFDFVIEVVRPSSSASSTTTCSTVQEKFVSLNDSITIEATGNLEEQKSNWL